MQNFVAARRPNMYFSKRIQVFIYLVLFIIFLSLFLYNVFYRLSNFPIYSWDEARHGISAYEMLKSRNFIVNTYGYESDYWNLKPPLSFWAIIIGYKMAGFNALGLRLISGICAGLTLLLVTLFVYKIHGKFASLVTLLTLSTCTQFLINHSARTGDADSLFLFLFTLSILSLFLSEHNDRWLYVSGLAFSLSFLTKSWHAGNIVIIMALYLLVSGKYKRLSPKKTLILGLCMFGPIIVWGVIRFHYDGFVFFRTMIEYDLLKRSSDTIEGHVGGFFYYAEILKRFFSLWLLFLFSLFLVILFKRDFSFKNFRLEKQAYFIGLCIWILIPIIVFTFSKTKIRWYILPVYPPLSIMIGILAKKVWINGNLMLRSLLLISMLGISFFYEGQIQLYLNEPRKSLQQNLLEKTRGMEGIKGYSLYLYHPTDSIKWSQSTLLTAELVNDFKTESGDFQAFLHNEKAILMAKKDLVTDQFIQANQLKIVHSISGDTF